MTDRWLSSEEQQAWRAYLTFHRELTARMNRQLQTDSQLSLTDYEVLVQLSEAPAGRLRPYEMVQSLQWEQSRLSHHLGRMQRRGLICREECTQDRRGAFIVLTPRGRAIIEEAAPAHAAEVRKLFFEGLTPEQVSVLQELSATALQRIETTAPVEATECPSSAPAPPVQLPG